MTLPPDLQGLIGEVVDFDISASQSFSKFSLLQDDLLPVVMERQLCANIALLAMAQDIA